MTSKTTKHPWDALSAPSSCGEFFAKLIAGSDNPNHKRVFWAKSWEARPALLVEYRCDPWKAVSLPTFKNIEVIDHPDERSLVIELLDLGMQDIFLKVCIDIVAALQDIPEKATRRACLLRLERWSSFLKPSRSKLSPEQQKGLIAELHFLERDMLDVHEAADALRGWTGPEAGPRDFAYGQTFIEVKSKRSSANPTIVISSEEQLNVNPTERLYLYVAELNSAPTDDGDAFTITDVVAEVRSAFDSSIQRALLDSKLANVGYFDEDDYSDSKWSEGGAYYYAVIEGFPKIDSHSCKPGVERVTYQVDLDYCEDYKVERASVLGAMG